MRNVCKCNMKSIDNIMLRPKHIIIDGLDIRYYQSDGISQEGTLVFLHGWGSQAGHFARTLEKSGNFVALDLPGFGGSQRPNTAWSLTEYRQFLRAFLIKFNIRQPVLVGHSFGGSIAIKYAARYGEDVKKLILIGSAGIRRKTPKKFLYLVAAKILKVIFSFPGLKKMRENMRHRFYVAIDSEDYLVAGPMTETYKKIISEDLEEEMKKINVPTTLIWGEDDDAVPLADGRLTEKLIKRSRLFVISHAGHYVFLDQEKEFDEIFLKSLS